MEKEVRVRVAPSPTGDPHVGTAYIALFNYVLAKQNNGKFVLRIEDTDRSRTKLSSEKQIFDTLNWCGLNWDEGADVGGDFGPYRQSERFEIYKKYATELIKKDKAYYCFCTSERLANLRDRQVAMKKAPGYDRHCRTLTASEIEQKIESGEKYVIRLKMPYESQTIVNDRLRGEIIFENDKIDDQVLLKSDGFPTYHLANVVDDHLMKITHVIRAEEWITSTPKHVQLYKAFGWEEPIWCHMPLLRNLDKTKISKRKNHVSLLWYIENGYLKDALVNFLALMGYSHGDNQEIFNLEDMIETFSFDKISLGGPVFDIQKLNWLNNLYMRKEKISDLAKLAFPYYKAAGIYTNDLEGINKIQFEKILEIAREPAVTLKNLVDKSIVFFNDEFEMQQETEEMNSKERKSVRKLYQVLEDENSKKPINLFVKKLENEKEEIKQERVKEILHEIMDELNEKMGKVLMPIRVYLTGQSKGPDLGSIVHIIGKTRTLKRINRILERK